MIRQHPTSRKHANATINKHNVFSQQSQPYNLPTAAWNPMVLRITHYDSRKTQHQLTQQHLAARNIAESSTILSHQHPHPHY